MTRSRGRPPA